MNKENEQSEHRLDQLKTSISKLIGEYKQAHSLLNNQIDAVVNHDLLLLNQLIEKQVNTYEVLKKSENQFKDILQTFYDHSDKGQTTSLSMILKDLEGPSETLDMLRDQLHLQVEKTEQLRSQLIDLLQFARQQNADIFKSICDLNAGSSQSYGADGKKCSRHQNGLAINQKA